jgi:hypothetical protein
VLIDGMHRRARPREKRSVDLPKDYPNLTFVISELGFFDTDLPALSSCPFATWPIPSLTRAKST